MQTAVNVAFLVLIALLIDFAVALASFTLSWVHDPSAAEMLGVGGLSLLPVARCRTKSA